MEVDITVAAIPYRFNSEEVQAIFDTFNNPLIKAYIQSYKLNILTERAGLGLFGNDIEVSVNDILTAEALTQGKLDILDSLHTVPQQLHQLIGDT